MRTMGCIESKDSEPMLCDLENLFMLPANTRAVPSSASSTSSSSSSSSSSTLRLLKDYPEHAEHVYHTPSKNVSEAPPKDKRRKKELRAENRALQTEVTRLKTLQDSHDIEMQRLRNELEKARKEQRTDSSDNLHNLCIDQGEHISQLTYEKSALTEENSSLMELLLRSQRDSDQKEVEIERLKSEINGASLQSKSFSFYENHINLLFDFLRLFLSGAAAVESQHFSTLTTRLSFLSPLKQAEGSSVNDTMNNKNDEIDAEIRESIDIYLCG